MAIFANLSIGVSANSARLNRDLGKMKKSTKKFTKSASADFKKLGSVIVGAFSVAAAKNLLNTLDEIAKQARSLNLTVRELQGLRYAFEQGGVEAGALSKSINKLQVSIGEAKKGTKTYTDALDVLGTSYEELDAMSPAQQIEFLVDRLKQIPSVTQRAQVANVLFGRSAKDLGTVLKDGSKGLRELREEAERFGIVINNETLESAERINDSLNTLSKTIRGALVKSFASGTTGAEEFILGLAEKVSVMPGVYAKFLDDTNEFLSQFDEDTIDAGKAFAASALGGLIFGKKGAILGFTATVDFIPEGVQKNIQDKLNVSEFTAEAIVEISEFVLTSAAIKALENAPMLGAVIANTIATNRLTIAMGARAAGLGFGAAGGGAGGGKSTKTTKPNGPVTASNGGKTRGTPGKFSKFSPTTAASKAFKVGFAGYLSSLVVGAFEGDTLDTILLTGVMVGPIHTRIASAVALALKTAMDKAAEHLDDGSLKDALTISLDDFEKKKEAIKGTIEDADISQQAMRLTNDFRKMDNLKDEQMDIAKQINSVYNKTGEVPEKLVAKAVEIGQTITDLETKIREASAKIDQLKPGSSANAKKAAQGFSTGGAVWGAGTATSDSIPAMLSNGEYVINAKATSKNRGLLEAINNGQVPKFANGGMVGRDQNTLKAIGYKDKDIAKILNHRSNLLEYLLAEVSAEVVNANVRQNLIQELKDEAIDVLKGVAETEAEVAEAITHAQSLDSGDRFQQNDLADEMNRKQERLRSIRNNAEVQAMKSASRIREAYGEAVSNGIISGFKNDGIRGAITNVAMIIANKFEQRAAEALTDALFGVQGAGSKGGLMTGFFSMLGFSNGGMVPSYYSNGGVAGGPKGTDTIPAWLTPGEVILNAAQQKNVVGAMSNGNGNNVTINISGNVDQRAINQIKQVVASDPSMIHQLNENGKRNGTGLQRRK